MLMSAFFCYGALLLYASSVLWVVNLLKLDLIPFQFLWHTFFLITITFGKVSLCRIC